MRLQLTIACLATLTLLAPMSLAQSEPSAADVKRAAEAFDNGRSAFRAENYVEAAEYLEAADGFAPRADTLRLAILARKAAGQLDRAMTLSALALALYADDPALSEVAQSVIDEGQSEHGRVDVSCDEDCDLLLDGKLVHGRKSPSRTLYVAPGEYSVKASWSEGRSQTEQTVVTAGEARAVEFFAPDLPPEPAQVPVVAAEPEPSDSGEEAKGGWSPIVFWTGVGLTAAGAGVSTYLGVTALNEPGKQRVQDECLDTTCDLYQQGRQNQLNATIAISATAAVGAFTIITGLWLTDWKGSGEDESPIAFRSGDLRISPTFSIGDGATLGATGTF